MVYDDTFCARQSLKKSHRGNDENRSAVSSQKTVFDVNDF